jgi:sodium-dependent dicarboxylate transporter 2/3/5
MMERILGRGISFFDWMAFGLPIAAACFAFLYVVVRWTHSAKVRELPGAAESIRRERGALGKWTAGEKAALAAFLVAVTLWTLPGILSLALGPDAPAAETVKRALPEGPCAILAACLLFVIPVDWPARKFALGWRQAVKIDWGTILLFGGGLSLGSLAFSTGLAEALGGAILNSSGHLSILLIALIAAYTANIMTEFMSNTATANLLIPMFLALAAGGTGGSIVPALAATLGCSLAFCLPVATPPNAIVYGSGHVSLTQMVRLGVVLDLGCGLLVWAGVALLPGWLGL